jgi:hypothetical protein
MARKIKKPEGGRVKRARPEPFVVRGQIRQADGRLLAGALVRAFDTDLRMPEAQLGEGVTRKDGRYEITYAAARFRRPGKKSADLVVRVFSKGGQELVSAKVIFNAKPLETVDLVIGGGEYRRPSDYERLVAELTPILEGIPLADLKEDEDHQDFTFLAGETGENRRHIEWLALAAKLGRETGLPAEVFYGFFRQNLPTTLSALSSQQPQGLRHALDAALRANVIPAGLTGQLDSILERLQEVIVDRLLEPHDEQGKATLGALLGTTLSSPGKRKKFVRLFVWHQGPREQFWRKLREDEDFQEGGLVDELQLALKLGALARNHLPMVKALQTLGPNGRLRSPRDLADLDDEGWTALIKKTVGGKPVGFPPDTPGKDDSEKIGNYAGSVKRLVEKAFPTAVFAARFQRKGIPGTEDLKADLDTFFGDNPDFDFRTAYIDKYFAEKTTLFGLPNRDALKNHLKRIQRVFKLTPHFEDIRVLLGGGIHSARQITDMGRRPFVEMYGPELGGGPRGAEIVWRLAERRTVLTGLAEMRYGWKNNLPQVAVVPPPLTQVEGIANWSELFGSVSYCECEHCRSVYSPAAYLVDLLHFIIDQMTLLDRERVPTSAREVLSARRPDIELIELTCKNTNTPVPYVDLVNELLENAVAPGRHDARWPQTDWMAEELRVNPEHSNPDAYIPLRDDAIYPSSLPWDSSLEETRLWLRHLSVERHELMKVFQQAAGAGEEAIPTDIEIATEHLGLSARAAEIITGTFPNLESPAPWESWGLQEDDNPVSGLDDPGQTVLVGWFEALRRVPVFLQRSGLSYEQLQELLDLVFINEEINGQPRIRIDHPVPCNLDASRIERLTGDDLRKIPRFLRLWRSLGWTMRELDQTLAALRANGLDALNNDTLLDLSHIQRLRSELDLPLDTLLTWWGTIDTRRYVDRTKPGQPAIPSLYERLFRNPAVLHPLPDPPFVEDPEQLEGLLSSQAAAISAALAVSTDDFSSLTSSPLVLPVAADDPAARERLDLDNLSALYRHVTLARALRLPVLDYLSVRALISTDPFTTPNAALQFVEEVNRIRTSAFSIRELSYLLRHSFDPASGIAPDEAGMTLVLSELRDGLQKMNDDRMIVSDDNPEALRVRQEIFVRERVATAFGLESAVAGSLLETVLEPRGDAGSVMENFLRLTSAGGLSAVYYDTPNLAGGEVRRTDPRVDFDWGIQSPGEGIPADAFSARWSGKILAQHSETHTFFVRCDDGCRLWVDGRLLIDEWHDQEAAEHGASILLTAGQFYDITLEYYENGVQAVAELSWSGASTPKEIIPASRLYPRERQEEARELLAVLHKVTLMLKRLNVTARELAHVAEHGNEFDGFDFNALPLAPVASPAPTFSGWKRFVDFFRLRDLLPGGADTLNAVVELANADRDALLDALGQRTAWNRDDLAFLLVGPDALRLRYPEDFQNGHALSRLHECFGLLKRLGVSARQCHDWARPRLGQADADSARHAVKSKYDQERWLAVARPVQDVLREKRRTVLVAYLTSHPIGERLPFADANSLFNHFLIDVETSSCMVTSRIKQAIGSVQLFIQRCLMNLEPAGYPDPDEDWAVFWGWMKNYRIWEANRKVFLWPENWIEPELRDDKSPFFKELENELLQNEVTADNTEAAFRNYLAKLDAVARLEVCGMYHELEEDADVVHVFARTFGVPHVYYYRRRVACYWTAWERVDLDIQGDHLIPVAWNRRLYLFWPIFTEMEDGESQIGDPNESGEAPRKQLEIQLAWSEYKTGKWSAKQVTGAAADARRPDHGHDGRRSLGRDGDPLVLRARLPENPAIGHYKSRIRFRAVPAPAAHGVNGLAGDSGDLVVACYAFARWLEAGLPDLEEVVELGRFRFTGCNGKTLVEDSLADLDDSYYNAPEDARVVVRQPGATEATFMRDLGGSQLSLVTGRVPPGAAEADLRELLRDTPVLNAVPGPFHLLLPHQYEQFTTQDSLFYEDTTRTFFIQLKAVAEDDSGVVGSSAYVVFHAFYHPYACRFVKQLNRRGIGGLLKWSLQEEPVLQLQQEDVFSDGAYQPQDCILAPYPVEDVDILPGGAYSLYNWELFFHAPLLMADRLSKNQRFEEAREWFHYIFDPTDRSDRDPLQRYWKFKKFYNDASNPIQTLEDLLSDEETLTGEADRWRKHPFNPDLIARTRIGAYQKTVVMKYLDNLIAWGDQLFRRETIESINEAVLLYVLAADVLGPKPVKLPARTVEARNYSQAREGRFDALSNFEAENLFVFDDLAAGGGGFDPAPELGLPGGDLPFGEPAHAHVVTTWYFCIPPNDKLLSYWDTVADRLFKIRHCMTLEGVVRQLPLFEPPIEPGLLVRAAAAGVDINSALNDVNAALPHYRFSVMLQQATELCNEVKSLGASLLAALEKKDAEALALLRSGHELNLLENVRQIKEKQIAEATDTLEGLRQSRLVIEERHKYYLQIKKHSKHEELHMDDLKDAHAWQQTAQLINAAASAAHLLPDGTAGTSGWAGSPVITGKFGGQNLGSSLQAASSVASVIAAGFTHSATMASIRGGYERRWEDWKLQERLARKELDQIDRQISAAEIRQAIAESDLANHDKQIENAREADGYMRGKFTNPDLYNWMLSQISGTYFQCYQMAYDVAKRAERCFRYELGLQDTSYISFGYWDSLKKGLLSGENLHYDLRRLEAAYLEQNRREFELIKHVSLILLDPLALVTLRETGRCSFRLPEEIFDLDYPGHYFRRIKSVSLTLPCVVGPYTTISCTLRLVKNSTRINTSDGDNGYPRNSDDDGGPADDGRFIENSIPVKAIAASSCQNDSGVFELNFRDERYLPFEGAGAVSDWSLELFHDLPSNNPEPGNPDFGRPLRQFDYGTISDVVLQVRYTAREDAGPFKNGAVAHLRDYFSQDGATHSLRLFDLRQEFPTQWHRFLQPTDPENGNTFELEMSPDLFPIRDQGKTLKVNRIVLLARCTDAGSYDVALTPPLPVPPPAGSNTITLAPVDQYGGMHFGQKEPVQRVAIAPADPPVVWRLRMTRPGGGNLQVDPAREVEDVLLVLGYEWE